MNASKPIVAAAPRRKYTLADVKKGKLDVPRRILGYGLEKVGKSSFAADAPSAIHLGPDNGTPHLDIERLPVPETWEDVFEILALVESNPEWKTLVIDPVNWLEDLVWARVVGGPNSPVTNATRDKIEQHGGGYMKGYEAAVSYWRVLTRELEKRHCAAGRHVILLAHAKKENFKDPIGVNYDRYEIKMHHKAAGLLREWADDVLFFRHEILAKVEGTKTIAVSTDERIIHTQWSKSWDAGNRSNLPPELPMSWDAYWAAVQSGKERVAQLKAEIATLLSDLGDSDLTKKVNAAVAEAKDSEERLRKFIDSLKSRINNAPTNEGTKS